MIEVLRKKLHPREGFIHDTGECKICTQQEDTDIADQNQGNWLTDSIGHGDQITNENTDDLNVSLNICYINFGTDDTTKTPGKRIRKNIKMLE